MNSLASLADRTIYSTVGLGMINGHIFYIDLAPTGTKGHTSGEISIIDFDFMSQFAVHENPHPISGLHS